MFGIESLREEVQEIKDLIEEFREDFKQYKDTEVTFNEMQNYLNGALKDFQEDLEAKNISDEILNKLDEILKKIQHVSNGKDKKK
jgi:hypothetical protein